MAIQRRQIRFERLEEAIADAEHLLSQGYVKTGNWDLTQCCEHLTKVMLYPIDGFPKFPFPLNLLASSLRFTIAPLMLKRILAKERFPAGTRTDPASEPVAKGRDAEGVAEFRAAVHRLLSHDGPWHTSPLFGQLDKDTLIRLHRVHTAHHLSFLVPR